ncbi:hypothetical protein BT96DRAFT_807369, partial [Gymnopus androsaceus JB14]
LATYTIDNWPATSIKGLNSLEAIRDTHIVNIPPFYDMRYMILDPKTYQCHLEGAVTKAKAIKNVFTADVVDIVIIHGAPPCIITPKCSCIYAIHPSSPTKKKCT